MVLTEYHIEYHGDEFRIKFYTAFKASHQLRVYYL